MAKKKDFYNQSISGEDIELLAQFTGKLDKVLCCFAKKLKRL